MIVDIAPILAQQRRGDKSEGCQHRNQLYVADEAFNSGARIFSIPYPIYHTIRRKKKRSPPGASGQVGSRRKVLLSKTIEQIICDAQPRLGGFRELSLLVHWN